MSNQLTQGRAILWREIAGAETLYHERGLLTLIGEALLKPWFWAGRSRQRRQLGELAELNNHLLKDIGVSQEEALREAAKPFWR
jgi:uncharacterized protein YjiS (DUF1127 family)